MGRGARDCNATAVAAVSVDDIRGALRGRPASGLPAWTDADALALRTLRGRLVSPLDPGDAVRVDAAALLEAFDADPPGQLTGQQASVIYDELTAYASKASRIVGVWKTCQARAARTAGGGRVAALGPDDPVVVAIRWAAGDTASSTVTFELALPASAVTPREGDMTAVADDITRLDAQPRPAEQIIRVRQPQRKYLVTFPDGTEVAVTARSEAAAERIARARHDHRPGQPVRARSRARSTGTVIEIVDADHPDAPIGRGAGDGRWVTLCDLHQESCHHDTLTLARRFAATPQEWCEKCRWLHDEITFSDRLDAFLEGRGPDPRVARRRPRPQQPMPGGGLHG